MSKKMYCVIIAIILAVFLLECYNSYRFNRELKALTELAGTSEQSADRIREGLEQQERTLAQLSEEQLRIGFTVDNIEGSVRRTESQLEELASRESAVDGDFASIRNTVTLLDRTIGATVEAVEQEGVEL